MSTKQLTPEQIQQAEKRALGEHYPMRVINGLDKLGNLILGGKPDETISARAGRAALSGNKLGKAVSGVLGLFQKHHVELAMAGDLAKANAIATVEDDALSQELYSILHMPDGPDRDKALDAFVAAHNTPGQ